MIKNRIKEFRAKHDMKQDDLAKLVGVRRETIGNLEKGRYNPSLVLAWTLASTYIDLWVWCSFFSTYESYFKHIQVSAELTIIQTIHS